MSDAEERKRSFFVFPVIKVRKQLPLLNGWFVGSVAFGTWIIAAAWRATFGAGWVSWMIGSTLLALGVLSFLLVEIDYEA